MKKFKDLWSLFFTMFKIGLFTFGGGYAMIHLLDNEFVAKKKWISSEDFLDLVSIAESTPGPIAINCSTYLGYKRLGVAGSAAATVGVCLPSFIIIFLISLFFDRFMELAWVSAAFRGIQSCVIFLILSAGIKMLKKLEKSVLNLTVFGVVFVCMILFSLLSVSFSSVFYILISAAIGVFVYSLGYFRNKAKTNESEEGEK